MKKSIKLLIISGITLLVIFIVSFIATDIYLNNKSNDNDDTNKVASSGNNSANKLDEKTKISLFKNDKKEKEATIGELKTELGLEGEVTEEVLSTALKKEGYELETKTSNELSYSREAKSSIEPNKYYIKEYNGYLAIFKSDDKGNLKIEDQNTDIFKNKKKFKDLPSTDQEQINNYERKFNNKLDAEDGIYELIS